MKPLKALRGYLRGKSRGSKGSRITHEALRGSGPNASLAILLRQKRLEMRDLHLRDSGAMFRNIFFSHASQCELASSNPLCEGTESFAATFGVRIASLCLTSDSNPSSPRAIQGTKFWEGLHDAEGWHLKRTTRAHEAELLALSP